MKSRLLKSELGDPGYIVWGDKTKLCIGSQFCSDLIKYDRLTKKITYALESRSNDLENYLKRKGNKVILDIFLNLKKWKESGVIEKFFEGDDTVDNPMTIYTFDYKLNKIVEKQTEEGQCEWPNITLDGEIMYDNTHFDSRKECVKRSVNEAKAMINNAKERISYLNDEQKELKGRVLKAEHFIRNEDPDNDTLPFDMNQIQIGRTTSLILMAISEATGNIGEEIEFVDHKDGLDFSLQEHANRACQRIMEFVKKLGVQVQVIQKDNKLFLKSDFDRVIKSLKYHPINAN